MVFLVLIDISFCFWPWCHTWKHQIETILGLGTSLFFRVDQLTSSRILSIAAWPEETRVSQFSDDLLIHEIFYLFVCGTFLCLYRHTGEVYIYIINQIEQVYRLTYVAEPLSEGRGACEDGGLLHLIAGTGRNKAGDSLDVPPTILTQTVQRTTRVSLKERETLTYCSIK